LREAGRLLDIGGSDSDYYDRQKTSRGKPRDSAARCFA
jgi:hypothetical protein